MWLPFLYPTLYEIELKQQTQEDVRRKGQKLADEFARVNYGHVDDNFGEKVFRYIQTDAGSIVHKILYVTFAVSSLALFAVSFCIPAFSSNVFGLFIGFFAYVIVWIALGYYLLKQLKIKHELSWDIHRYAVRRFCICLFVHALAATILLAVNIILMVSYGEEIAGNNLTVVIIQGVACIIAWVMWIIEKNRKIAVIK